MKYFQIKPPLGIWPNWKHPLAQGLIHCWPMKEGGGNVVNDLLNTLDMTGYGTAGTPLWTPGNHGAALLYDDADLQYHQVNIKPNLTDYPFSIICWFLTDSIGATQNLLFFW